MKVILEDKNISVLRFDRGDEVIQGLKNFCVEKGIQAGSVTAIGGAGEVVLSYFNVKTKEYEDMEMRGKNLEVVGVVGTVSVHDEEIVIHVHGTIAGEDLIPKAGHIKKMTISTTAEVVVTAFKGKIERYYDETTGLNLLKNQ